MLNAARVVMVGANGERVGYVLDATRLTVLATAALAVLAASPVAALDVRVGWTPVQGVAGYRLYVRQFGQTYNGGVDVGPLHTDVDGVVRYVYPGLPIGVTNYFAVTAYDESRRESGLSNELSLLVTATPTVGVAATASSTATANATLAATATRTATLPPTASRTPAPTNSPVETVAASDLVAAYGFSEGSGTTTADASGNGHTGVLFGNPEWLAGLFDSALQFSGGTTYDGINLTPNNGFDGLSEGTLEAWVEFDTSAPAGLYDWFSGRDAAGCSYPFEFEINNRTGTVYWEIWAGDTAQCTATFHARVALANPSQWHHLAYVVSDSGNTWYVDGVPQTPTYFAGSAASTFFFASIAASPDTRYDVGTTDIQSGTFKGTIDELRIYARPLTQAEIQADAFTPVSAPVATATRTVTRMATFPPTASRTPTPTSSPVETVAASDLVAAYGFSEGSGTTTADASGNGHTGVLFGNPEWLAGLFDSALQFSGGTTYDGINLTPNNGFDGLSEGTLEAWVEFDTSAPAGLYDWFSGRDAAGCSYPFEFEINNRTGTVYWEIWAGDTAQCTATFHARVALANPSQWHHLAYVVSDSGNTWYVDGVPQTPTYFAGSAASTFFFASIAASPDTRYDVGTTDIQSGTFKGTIDELRIYARPLTQAEIQTDASTPVSAPTTTLPAFVQGTDVTVELPKSDGGISWQALYPALGVGNSGSQFTDQNP